MYVDEGLNEAGLQAETDMKNLTKGFNLAQGAIQSHWILEKHTV